MAIVAHLLRTIDHAGRRPRLMLAAARTVLVMDDANEHAERRELHDLREPLDRKENT